MVLLVGSLAYRRSHRFRYITKTILYFGCLALSSFAGMLAAPVLSLFGLGGYSNYFVGQITKRIVPLVTGIKVVVQGREHLWACRPCVFIANHQARLDMLAMYVTLQIH